MHETNFINGIRLEAFKGNVGELLSIGTDGVVCISASIQSITGNLNSRLITIENNYATKATPVSGTYNNITVNSQGIVISGSNLSYALTSSIPTSATFLDDYDARYANESDLTVTLGNYTLLSTTASISGSLQNQINSKQNIITLVAGNNVSIVETPTNTWTISASISGGSSGIQGRKQLNATDVTYVITHPTIDTSVEFPVATLEVSSATSDLFIVGIHNRTPTSFQVTLSGVADVNTYILWHISTQSSISPNTIASSGGSIMVTQDGVNFNLEVASSQDYPKTFSYNDDDQLTLIIAANGTQSFSYDISGNLINIVGTGSYASKNFSYDGEDKLTGITII